MSSFMEGIVVSDLKGLNNLNVLNPDMPLMDGISCSSDVTTTMKSSQFHASER